jgi:hypothetical protein
MTSWYRRIAVAVLALATLPTCFHSPDPPPETVPCLQGTEPLFARYEAIGQANDCRSDGCAAERTVSTCELVPTPQADFGCRRCACFEGTCRWVR